ncbi:hypothetical protein GIB67_021115 [Kingdonia uniflora]|uniref:Uncharacterized protein n=1 Tax=Kingdonia uniflora TaxID=39325 RepID=A0A7J7N759_9MAGN|nr:hypothetical protein GIB67_021115 [Kingdonia uniflora]
MTGVGSKPVIEALKRRTLKDTFDSPIPDPIPIPDKRKYTKRKKGADISDQPSSSQIEDQEDVDDGVQTEIGFEDEINQGDDDVNQVQQWCTYARNAELDIKNFVAEEGYYYNSHSSQDGDCLPTLEELARGEEFDGIDTEIIRKFNYSHIKNESFRLRMKFTDEKYKLFAFVSRLSDGHTMELRGHCFEHDYMGIVGTVNKMANASWVVNEIEDMVRDV